MTKANPKRHLQERELIRAAEWIMEQRGVPSWEDVRTFALREFGVDRTVEALRRAARLKAARDAKEAAPPVRQEVKGYRAAPRKRGVLEAENRRLAAEIKRLEAENTALVARNLRLINGARVFQIPEGQLDRPLTPVDRSPTLLPGSEKRK